MLFLLFFYCIEGGCLLSRDKCSILEMLIYIYRYFMFKESKRGFLRATQYNHLVFLLL